MAFRGTPPAPSCGMASPYTAALRPPIGLSPERCEAARRIRRRNPDATPAAIAAQLGEGATEADVALALHRQRDLGGRRVRGAGGPERGAAVDDAGPAAGRASAAPRRRCRLVLRGGAAGQSRAR